MFEDGAKLDDILNALKPPTLDKDDDKKDRCNFDSVIRYNSKRTLGDDMINFEFAGQKTLGVLK